MAVRLLRIAAFGLICLMVVISGSGWSRWLVVASFACMVAAEVAWCVERRQGG